MRLDLDYPLNPRPRYELGKGAHPQLQSIFSERKEKYFPAVEAFAGFTESLARVPLLPRSLDISQESLSKIPEYYARAMTGDTEALEWFNPCISAVAASTEPCWLNGFLPALDAVALYASVALNNPRTYLEVGSGNSTKFVRKAIIDHGLQTRIVSIDPQPRAMIDSICDEVIRSPLEDCDLSVFARLEAGDVVFMDGSHRCLMNSDATVFFLDVIPNMPEHISVGVHDIYLPYDYPARWSGQAWSEQYLVAAFLLANPDFFDIQFPATFATFDQGLNNRLSAMWECLPDVIDTTGSAFWFRT